MEVVNVSIDEVRISSTNLQIVNIPLANSSLEKKKYIRKIKVKKNKNGLRFFSNVVMFIFEMINNVEIKTVIIMKDV
jgi:hypothetical protein|tara:strand:+ start:163 stop:393 length:231 start_codon:yes stop_codon:yes gene_type:complete